MLRLLLFHLYITATLLPLVLSWQLHKDLPEGIWEIYFVLERIRHQNHVIYNDWTKYADVTIIRKQEHPFKVSHLPITHHGCAVDQKFHGYGNILPQKSDVERARDMLANWCEMYRPKKGALIVATVGNASWYICNWDFYNLQTLHKQKCSRWELMMAEERMDYYCGANHTAYVHMEGWNKAYGRGIKPGELCPDMERYPRPAGHNHEMDWLVPVDETQVGKGNATAKYCNVQCLDNAECLKRCFHEYEKTWNKGRPKGQKVSPP